MKKKTNHGQVKPVVMPETLLIEVNGIQQKVNSHHYIKAKTKQLKEFGYLSLTENEVEKQIILVLNHGTLNVIGMMIQDDIVQEA